MAEEHEILELYIKPQFESIHQKLDQINTTLNGNGEGGIKSDVAVAKNNIKSLQKWRTWIIGVLTTVTLMVAGIVIRHLLR